MSGILFRPPVPLLAGERVDAIINAACSHVLAEAERKRIEQEHPAKPVNQKKAARRRNRR